MAQLLKRKTKRRPHKPGHEARCGDADVLGADLPAVGQIKQTTTEVDTKVYAVCVPVFSGDLIAMKYVAYLSDPYWSRTRCLEVSGFGV
jgi:hypothetical protein